jgi:hypothetical protein
MHILLLKSSPQRNTIEFIEKSIAEEELIGSRDWLLEKLYEMKLKLHASRTGRVIQSRIPTS